MLPLLVSRFPATAAEGGGMTPLESNALLSEESHIRRGRICRGERRPAG
jgi:hypothetical protein